jgi:hypothetical protein
VPEKKYGLRVSYEDPQYQFAGNLVDMTDPAYRNAHPTKKSLMPKGGKISWSAIISEPSKTILDPMGLLQSLLASHNSNGNPGLFSAVSLSGVYFIVRKDRSWNGTNKHADANLRDSRRIQQIGKECILR